MEEILLSSPINAKNSLEENLKKLSLEKSVYEYFKQKSELKAKESLSSPFSDRIVVGENHVFWYMKDKPLLETEYNVFVVMNSQKNIGLTKKHDLIGETEPGFVVLKIDKNNHVGLLLDRIKDDFFFEKLLKDYEHKKIVAQDALKLARRSVADNRTVDFEDLTKKVLTFTSQCLDFALPSNIFEVYRKLGKDYFLSLEEKDTENIVYNLLLNINSDYFYRTEKKILDVLEKNLSKGRFGISEIDTKKLIDEAGYLQRNGLLPHKLEDFYEMNSFALSYLKKYDTLEKVLEQKDNLYFKQRINRQSFWKARNKVLINIDEDKAKHFASLTDFFTLGLKYNEENRDIRNSYFSFVTKYCFNNFGNDIKKIRLRDLNDSILRSPV